MPEKVLRRRTSDCSPLSSRTRAAARRVSWRRASWRCDGQENVRHQFIHGRLVRIVEEVMNDREIRRLMAAAQPVADESLGRGFETVVGSRVTYARIVSDG